MKQRNKKAEMHSEIFVYILAMVIGVGILLYGYSAIKNFRSQADDILMIQFENGIKNDLKSISFDSIKTKKYSLPATVSQVCFAADGATSISVAEEEMRQQDLKKNYQYPLIQDAIGNYLESGSIGTTNNIFIYPNGEKAFFSEVKITLDESITPIKFKCFDVNSGVLTIRIKGKGNSVLIQ